MKMLFGPGGHTDANRLYVCFVGALVVLTLAMVVSYRTSLATDRDLGSLRAGLDDRAPLRRLLSELGLMRADLVRGHEFDGESAEIRALMVGLAANPPGLEAGTGDSEPYGRALAGFAAAADRATTLRARYRTLVDHDLAEAARRVRGGITLLITTALARGEGPLAAGAGRLLDTFATVAAEGWRSLETTDPGMRATHQRLLADLSSDLAEPSPPGAPAELSDRRRSLGGDLRRYRAVCDEAVAVIGEIRQIAATDLGEIEATMRRLSDGHQKFLENAANTAEDSVRTQLAVASATLRLSLGCCIVISFLFIAFIVVVYFPLIRQPAQD
ncbi:MAG: hypothetical protein WCO00_00120 [Rhodospirillaceae bacterium]